LFDLFLFGGLLIDGTPDTVADTATYAEPHRYPEGIHHVLVNGRFVVYEGVQTEERPGRVLRRER
jgi:N-acyl-D-amino-acid deacylase